MKDKWKRNINYIRISVTDRCNLRCCYCMPEEGIEWESEDQYLSFDEIEKIVQAGAQIGIEKIKITGGEPLVRKGVTSLIANLKKISGIQQVTLTTNGVLLEENVDELVKAHIDSINVNLPSMDQKSYMEITRRDEFFQVYRGIEKAIRQGLQIRINCVNRENLLDSEIQEFLALIKKYQISVRFIEMMPIGYGKLYKTRDNDDIYKKIEELSNEKLTTSTFKGNGPAIYYDLKGYLGNIGFVSAVTHQFCDSCNRVRVSAQGDMKLCLNHDVGISLKKFAQTGTIQELKKAMEQAIYEKPKEHCFYQEEQKDIELKNMVQIGG